MKKYLKIVSIQSEVAYCRWDLLHDVEKTSNRVGEELTRGDGYDRAGHLTFIPRFEVEICNWMDGYEILIN